MLIGPKDVPKGLLENIHYNIQESMMTRPNPPAQLCHQDGWGMPDGPLSDRHFQLDIIKGFFYLEESVRAFDSRLRRRNGQSNRGYIMFLVSTDKNINIDSDEEPIIGDLPRIPTRLTPFLEALLNLYEMAYYGNREFTEDQYYKYTKLLKGVVRGCQGKMFDLEERDIAWVWELMVNSSTSELQSCDDHSEYQHSHNERTLDATTHSEMLNKKPVKVTRSQTYSSPINEGDGIMRTTLNANDSRTQLDESQSESICRHELITSSRRQTSIVSLDNTMNNTIISSGSSHQGNKSPSPVVNVNVGVERCKSMGGNTGAFEGVGAGDCKSTGFRHLHQHSCSGLLEFADGHSGDVSAKTSVNVDGSGGTKVRIPHNQKHVKQNSTEHIHSQHDRLTEGEFSRRRNRRTETTDEGGNELDIRMQKSQTRANARARTHLQKELRDEFGRSVDTRRLRYALTMGSGGGGGWRHRASQSYSSSALGGRSGLGKQKGVGGGGRQLLRAHTASAGTRGAILHEDTPSNTDGEL
eukprot:CFRG6224T1